MKKIGSTKKYSPVKKLDQRKIYCDICKTSSHSWVGECLNIDVLSNADNLRLPIILPGATSLSLPKKETLWILLSKQHKLNSVLNQIPRYIPHICHFLYTGKIFQAKILHLKARKLRQIEFRDKIA